MHQFAEKLAQKLLVKCDVCDRGKENCLQHLPHVLAPAFYMFSGRPGCGKLLMHEDKMSIMGIQRKSIQHYTRKRQAIKTAPFIVINIAVFFGRYTIDRHDDALAYEHELVEIVFHEKLQRKNRPGFLRIRA